MLPLRDLQKLFAGALFDYAPDAVAPRIHGSETEAAQGVAIDAHARLAIYRNNLHEGFRKAWRWNSQPSNVWWGRTTFASSPCLSRRNTRLVPGTCTPSANRLRAFCSSDSKARSTPTCLT